MNDLHNLGFRAALVALVALTAVGTYGCHRRVVVNHAQASRYQRNLLRYAQRDTGCQAGQLTPVQIGQQPDVFTVTGCTFPVEYWLSCGRRGRRCSWQRIPTLNEQAAAPLQCQPQMIQQQLTQNPNVRVAGGCGNQGTFQMACNGQACGWALAGPIAGQAVATAPPPPAYQGGAGGGVAVQPTAQPGQETAAVQAQLQSQREAILSCIDGPGINLTVRWTAQGLVQIALPPEMAGSAAEGCIQAALGTLRVAATQAGQVTIPVQ
ncbi:MAG: hypothetical protein H6719_20760 [Sandaracinaceae bacterium]|nr:hypothetical protein [Sandaracinaceae bacterium]